MYDLNTINRLNNKAENKYHTKHVINVPEFLKWSKGLIATKMLGELESEVSFIDTPHRAYKKYLISITVEEIK